MEANFPATSITVALSPDLQSFVAEKVRAGQYADANEVVSGALTALRDQETLTSADVQELRREIGAGLAELDRGEGIAVDLGSLAEFFEGVKARGRTRLHGERSSG